MRFKHRKGPFLKKSKNNWLTRVLLPLFAVTFLSGIYLLILVLTPNIPVLFPVNLISVSGLPLPTTDMVYIPKIGVSVPLNSGEAEVLEKGAWHRFSERGDPVKGGNFIVSGHRFSLGITPSQVRQKSPFYHIDKLSIGDQVLVDFQGKRYGYEVIEEKITKPNKVEIEAESVEPKLTLYTCTLKGESDGREVFIARFLGEVDKNGMVQR